MAKPPEQLEVMSAPLSDQQLDWIEAAASQISEDWLRDLIVAMTSIPSPTGEEGPLAEFVVEALRAEGVAARYQPIDDLAGTVVASYGRPGDGPDLLFYAPLDTLTAGLAEEDCPWVGPELRSDMEAVRTEPSAWTTPRSNGLDCSPDAMSRTMDAAASR